MAHRSGSILGFVNAAGLAAVVAVLVAGGAQAQPAQADAAAPANADAGAALFARHCSRCHGSDARGTPQGPDLRLRVLGMSEASFTSAVLQRYRWSLPASESGGESAGLEAMLRGILSRQTESSTAMPAWETEPEVAQGVRSLYQFLSTEAPQAVPGR